MNLTLQNSSILSLSWIAPFTLDITYSLHDITYCVDIRYDGFDSRLLTECAITETQFSFPLPSRSWCGVCFTVTPVNCVGNGTSEATCFQNQTGTLANHGIPALS